MQDTKITNVEPHILTLSVSGFGFSAVSLVLHCNVQGLYVALEELLCLGHFTLQHVGFFFSGHCHGSAVGPMPLPAPALSLATAAVPLAAAALPL